MAKVLEFLASQMLRFRCAAPQEALPWCLIQHFKDCTGLHRAKGKPILKSKQMNQKLGRTVWYPLPFSASQCGFFWNKVISAHGEMVYQSSVLCEK